MDPSDTRTRIQRLGVVLRSLAGALRRRGLWLVFGALGGLIGGALIAANTKPTHSYKRYFKATTSMRLQTPATTTQAVDQVRWSLQLAQLAMTSTDYRKAVAEQTGVSTTYIKNHVMGIAFDDTASLDITAVTTEPEQAVQIAFHAARLLNDAIAEDTGFRRLEAYADHNAALESVNTLIDALREKLPGASDEERAQITKDLGAARRQARSLRDLRRGITVSPPVFAVSGRPEPIEINSKAYYRRWSMASSDLGVPNIRSNATLAGLDYQDAAGKAAVAKDLIADTELPTEKQTNPLQVMSLGLLAGFVMGLSGIVLGEAWDTRLHTPRSAMRATGMPVIVEIPRLSRRRMRALLSGTDDSDDPRVADATIRYREAASVLVSALGLKPRKLGDTIATRQRPAPVVLVTSTVPAEGKTTSTAALAAALAYLGFDVLAVDGDYHNRSLRKVLRPIPSFVDPEAPSPASIDRVWYLDDPYASERRSNSSALVASLVRRAISHRDDFDIILFDTPPVLATTDAVEYLQYAEAALMVVRIDQTDAQACEQTASSLLRHGLTTPGLIVTDVPPSAIDQLLEPGG